MPTRRAAPASTLLPTLAAVSLPLFLSACGDSGGEGSPTDPADGPNSNEPPTAAIRTPSDGADFPVGREVTFEGSAQDPEDGSLAGDALVWEASDDGELGTGRKVTTGSLSKGEHAVTLTATDSEGAADTARVSIRIRSGDLDAFVVNDWDGSSGFRPLDYHNTIWKNQGGSFTLSDSIAPSRGSNAVALGDLDGDGDLDAVVANGRPYGAGEDSGAYPNRVWINDGTGTFTADDALGTSRTQDVALGDLDGDGDQDVFAANSDKNWIYLNDGTGRFRRFRSWYGIQFAMAVSLGDLDGDGDLDAFVVNARRANSIWLNEDGSLDFELSQGLGGEAVADLNQDVALGDLDGDGDLDALDDGERGRARVWMNSGVGGFFATAPAQELEATATKGLALGDLDGDGDLDAFLARGGGPDKVWLNDEGRFEDTGQALTGEASSDVALGDVDGDGDLDAFVTAHGDPDRLWLNDGSAGFTRGGQPLGAGLNSSVALGDLDGG